MNTFLQHILPWRFYRFLWLKQTNHYIDRALEKSNASKATNPAQPTIGYLMWMAELAGKANTAAEFHVALTKTPLDYAPEFEASRRKIDQRLRDDGYRYWNYLPGQEEKG
ncbi:hypothetical protein Dxin01_00866 [Deinococcus xinjiangensis]|uniref:Uncharacterized protein n=1 Tax=Deinococcus xinjiangensis TaxID=457454 RepID=A0ABP9V774_9DEIO